MQATTAETSLTLQNTTQMVTSATTQVFSTDYVLPTAGTLTVSVSDQLFPSGLTQLDFSLLNGSAATLVGGPLSALNTAANPTTPQVFTWTFGVQAGSYSTLFSAAAASSAAEFPGVPPFALGLYEDTVTFTPAAAAVPLPPAGGVLLAGAGLLALLARRKPAVADDAAPVSDAGEEAAASGGWYARALGGVASVVAGW